MDIWGNTPIILNVATLLLLIWFFIKNSFTAWVFKKDFDNYKLKVEKVEEKQGRQEDEINDIKLSFTKVMWKLDLISERTRNTQDSMDKNMVDIKKKLEQIENSRK